MAVRIWSSGERQVNQEENEALKKRIDDLEERLTNLEMVDSLEAHMAEKHRSPEEPTSEGSVMGPTPPESTSS